MFLTKNIYDLNEEKILSLKLLKDPRTAPVLPTNSASGMYHSQTPPPPMVAVCLNVGGVRWARGLPPEVPFWCVSEGRGSVLPASVTLADQKKAQKQSYRTAQNLSIPSLQKGTWQYSHVDTLLGLEVRLFHIT